MDRTKLEPEILALLGRLRRFGFALGIVVTTSAVYLFATPRSVLLAQPRWLVGAIAILLGVSVVLLFSIPFMYSNYKRLGSARGHLRDQLLARNRRRS